MDVCRIQLQTSSLTQRSLTQILHDMNFTGSTLPTGCFSSWQWQFIGVLNGRAPPLDYCISVASAYTWRHLHFASHQLLAVLCYWLNTYPGPDSHCRFLHRHLLKMCMFARHWCIQCIRGNICSVLQPSSIRWLATSWTYFLHLSLLCAILIDSSMVLSCPRLDVVHPGWLCVVFLACTHLPLFPALSLSPRNSLRVPSWCDHIVC